MSSLPVLLVAGDGDRITYQPRAWWQRINLMATDIAQDAGMTGRR